MISIVKIGFVATTFLLVVGCVEDAELRQERATLHRMAGPVGLPVASLPLEAVRTSSEIIEGVIASAAVGIGGEFVAQVFVRPPVRAPRDLCIKVTGGGEVLHDAPLTSMDVGHRPGVVPAVLFRHRLYSRLPAGLSSGMMVTSFQLTDCSTGAMLDEVTHDVVVSDGRVPDAQLVAAAGQPLVERPTLPRVREVTKDANGDVLRTLPLPRVPRDGTQLVYALGRVDPTVWARPSDVLGGATDRSDPLIGLLQTIKSDFTVASIAAPATRFGVPPPPTAALGAPRRVVPEKLLAFVDGGVDGLLLGDKRVDDVGMVGRVWTHRNARLVGLDVPRRGSIRVPLEKSLPTVAVVDMTDGEWDAAPMRIAATDAQVILVAAAQTTRPQLHSIAELGVHGIWSVATDASAEGGVVDVYNGVPIIENLSVAISDEAQHPTELLRWYIDSAGVQRVDILLFQNENGVIRRDDTGEGRARLLARQKESAAVGTDLRVGKMMAGLDVRAHWPTSPPLLDREVNLPDRPRLSAPESTGIPPRCLPVEPPVPATSLGRGGLEISAWSIPTVRMAGEPIKFGLWMRRNDAHIGDGVMVWHGTGADDSVWRAILAPCDGSISLSSVPVQQAFSQEVWLWPPADQPEAQAPSVVSLQIRVLLEGDLAVLRQDDGRRAMRVEVPDQL
jgi:hypothetical protein